MASNSSSLFFSAKRYFAVYSLHIKSAKSFT